MNVTHAERSVYQNSRIESELVLKEMLAKGAEAEVKGMRSGPGWSKDELYRCLLLNLFRMLRFVNNCEMLVQPGDFGSYGLGGEGFSRDFGGDF